jgi:hypothetical protein
MSWIFLKLSQVIRAWRRGNRSFELFEQVIQLFKYSANQKNIKLLLHIDETIPQFLVGDA